MKNENGRLVFSRIGVRSEQRPYNCKNVRIKDNKLLSTLLEQSFFPQ